MTTQKSTKEQGGRIAELEAELATAKANYDSRPKTRTAEALRDAERYTGPNPRILALPKAFRTAPVHLIMRDE